jgi:hypothetical protein
MKTRKILFITNLLLVIFLGVGWFYFYSMILLDDITRMPRALTINATILGLNIIFAASLILLPIAYRNRK